MIFVVVLRLLAVPAYAATGDAAPSRPAGVAPRVTGAGIEFVTADDRSLYTYERDRPRASNCVDTCAQTWVPFAAEPDVKPIGDWEAIPRPNAEGWQWAWRGKPVYTYIKDIPGSAFGEGLQTNAWRVAFKPVFSPDGITIQVGNQGRYLADWENEPLFWRAEGDDCVGDCLVGWQPVVAPAIALEQIGDWSALIRGDGTRQWAFRDRALYRHDAGAALNDSRLTASGWAVAVLAAAPPVPAWVTQRSTDLGIVFANAAGLTLYTAPSNLDHVHRTICDPECVKKYWVPVYAKVDATPSGLWSISKDSDDNNVWAYRGEMLYLHKRDEVPGDYGGDEWGKGIFGTGWVPVMAPPGLMPDLN